MADRTMGRRQVLRGAGVVAGGAAVTGLGLASPAMASDNGNGGLTGSWLITRQDTGASTDVQAVFSFAGGDVLIEHDINPAGPPFTGTWARQGNHGFRATFWTGTPGGPGPGAAGPTVRVHAEGSV